MLLDIRCEAISSIKCHLRYDDGSKKTKLVAIDDLVDVIYNGNGKRKRIVGRVSDISTIGNDPHTWVIIIDGSDDFATNSARISPLAILDIEIIRKAEQDDRVRTPLGDTSVPYIRVVKGRLQYSQDGYTWKRLHIHEEDIIEAETDGIPEEFPRPENHSHHRHHRRKEEEMDVIDEDDIIEDAIY